MEELKCRISMEDGAPDVIALSEVRPKNAKFPRFLVEYQMEGYEMESRNLDNNTGRGIILYMSKSLKYRLKNLATHFEEFLAVTITTRDDLNNILLVSAYRSPNSTEENNAELINLINKLPYRSHTVIIIGDLNYPKIDWESWTTPTVFGSKEFIFIETLRDNFLSQLISDPTRFRGNDEPSTIDLVMTNDENRVGVLQQYPGLGKSDHVVIDLRVEGAPPKQERDKMFVDYNRGNFNRLRD